MSANLPSKPTRRASGALILSTKVSPMVAVDLDGDPVQFALDLVALAQRAAHRDLGEHDWRALLHHPLHRRVLPVLHLDPAPCADHRDKADPVLRH
jgi:hypothetical protein